MFYYCSFLSSYRSLQDRRGCRVYKEGPKCSVNDFRIALMVGLEQFGCLFAILCAIPHPNGATLQFFLFGRKRMVWRA